MFKEFFKLHSGSSFKWHHDNMTHTKQTQNTTKHLKSLTVHLLAIHTALIYFTNKPVTYFKGNKSVHNDMVSSFGVICTAFWRHYRSDLTLEAIVNNGFFPRVVNISILYIVGQDSNKHLNRRCHQYLVPNIACKSITCY